MDIRRQSTLCKNISASGIELHGGNITRLTLYPANVDTGLIFKRIDITDKPNLIKVSPQCVSRVHNCTTISNNFGVEVSTVEHLMAALAATGIDNLIIEIDGREIPAMDGSAEPFLKMIDQAGICKQALAREYIKVLKPVEVIAGAASVRIEPCHRLELDVSIDFHDAAIGQQRASSSDPGKKSRHCWWYCCVYRTVDILVWQYQNFSTSTVVVACGRTIT